jgi:cation diffusion facilitator CzcD-associated flavoprotein CzcO
MGNLIITVTFALTHWRKKLNTSSKPKRDLRFIIVGAGMAGILAAIRLQQAGYQQIVIYEKADRIGGTWRDNTYPGLYCDVPAHAYTYSFEPYAEWSGYLARGDEIQTYFEVVTHKYQVDKYIQFNQEINHSEFRDGHWHITTKSGLTAEGDVLILASGVLHHINMPQIEGLDSFNGSAFHSARWNHDVQLDGRRVGIIGNGSTGVQIVSALSNRPVKVVHVQRSPQWIMPTVNSPYSEEQKALFRSDTAEIDKIRYDPEYVGNVRHFTDAIVDMESPQIKQIEAVVLDNLERSVTDPLLKEKLRPSYRAACKRLIFSPDYYQAIQRPSVEISVGKIARIEPTGIRMADGTLHEVDVLVFATGFRAGQFIRPATVIGRNGIRLDEVWKVRPNAYMAISVPNFPNMFMLNGPTGPVGNFSLIDIAERQWSYIEKLIAELDAGTCREICVTTSAMMVYDSKRIEAAKKTIFASGCQSWYLDGEGVPGLWPWSYDAFADAMDKPVITDFDRQ